MAIAGAIAVDGSLGFAAVVWLHARRPDVNPATEGISRYAVGATRTAAAVAFLFLSIGLVGGALLLSAHSPGGWLQRACFLAAACWIIGIAHIFVIQS